MNVWATESGWALPLSLNVLPSNGGMLKTNLRLRNVGSGRLSLGDTDIEWEREKEANKDN